jgi:electron transfer flavoprotein beta subunit
MDILVAIKQIIDPTAISVDRKMGRISVSEPRGVINPADGCALEAALALKDKIGARITIASYGPPETTDLLRRGLAMGADRAIWISDETVNRCDESVLARLLAALVKKLGNIDLACLGGSALDTAGAQIGARLAQALDWAYLAEVASMEIENASVRVVCSQDQQFVGYQANLPAVIAFSTLAAAPRYPRAPALVSAYRRPGSVETWTPAQLGLQPVDLAPCTIEFGPAYPPPKERWRITSGTIEDQAAWLAAELRGG